MTSKVDFKFSNQLIFCLMVEKGYTWIEFCMLISIKSKDVLFKV